MLKQSKTIAAFTGMVLMALSSSVTLAQQAPTIIPVVELAEVSEAEVHAVSRLPGTVISLRDASIAAEVNGRLSWIADVGQRIQKGEPLALIDDHLFKLQQRNDVANIKRIKADISYQHSQQRRLQKLVSKNNIAQSELDQLESRIDILAQDLRIAEVNLDRTLYNIELSHVKAPFAGIVAAQTMNEGEFTQAGNTLLRLVDTDNLEISVNAPLRIARYNRVGGKVSYSIDKQLYQTNIRGAVPIGDQRSRMMELRLKVPTASLLIGEAVTVELANSSNETALMVPRDALILRENNVYVYTLGADNKAIRVSVVPGHGKDEQISVQGALKVGDKIIIRGAESLSNGQEVKTIKRVAVAG